MSDALERKIEENSNIMKEMLRKMGGSSTPYSGSAPSSNSSGGQSWDASKNFISSLTSGVSDFTGKLVRNQADITDVTNFAANALQQLGLPADLFGQALTGITKYAVEAVDNWKQFSDIGVSTYGSAMFLQNAIGRTGLSAREFGEVFSVVGDQVLKFKGTMSEGIDGLSYMVREFNEPTRLAAFARMGTDQKTANEMLGTVIRGASTYQLATKEGQEQVIKSAEIFAKEIDATAKATGLSRKAMLDSVKGAQDDYRTRAAMLLYQRTDPAAAANLNNIMQGAAKDLGPVLKDFLVQSVASGGTTGGQYQSQINAMLPRTAELVREISVLNKGTAEDKLRAEILSKTVSDTAANEIRTNESALRQAVIGNQNFRDIMSEVLGGAIYNKAIGGNAAATAGQGTVGAKTMLEQGGYDAQGITVAGQETTKLIMNVNQRIKEMGAESTRVINETNKELDKYLTDINSSVSAVRGYTNEGKRYMPDVMDKIKSEFFGGKDPATFFKELANYRDNPTGPSPHTVPNAEVDATSGGRSHGTEGVIGKRREPKDATVSIHKDENVLNPSEAAWYDSMGGMSGIQSMMEQLSSASGTLGVSPGSTSSILPMMSSVLRNVSSQISSAAQNAQNTSATASGTAAIDSAFLEKFLESLAELNKTSTNALATQVLIAQSTDKTASNTKDMSRNVY